MQNNLIVTISRQYGSGGRQIGEALAKRLGIPFYDRELIDLAAKQSGVPAAFFVQPEEERIVAIDKRRAAYFRFYTGVDGRQMEEYHLCLDSGVTGIDGGAALLELAYRQKEREENNY